MNPVAKEKWVTALRSGDYKQTTGKLKHESKEDGFSYCCLGVLCEVAVEEGIISESSAVDEGLDYFDEVDHQFAGVSSFLPDTVAKWADINEFATIFSLDIDLVRMNDSEKFNFQEIANTIENHF